MRIGPKVRVRWYKRPQTINEVIASLQSCGSSVSHRFGHGQIEDIGEPGLESPKPGSKPQRRR